MLIYEKGDLLKSDCTIIMHQANCFSTMGAGIAKLIAELYPEAEIADREYIGKPEDKLGKFSFATVKNITIVNLYGQFHYGRGKQTNYKMLEKAINDFIEFAKENKINMDKIGVPYKMGCGLAGGDWAIVEKILFEQSEKHNLNIYIYQLQKETNRLKLNHLELENNSIILRTNKPLLNSITKEFTEYKINPENNYIKYKFEPMPNQCFSLRALLAKYKVFTADKEVLRILHEKTQLATMPILSLYETGKHVKIECPPLDYYLNFVTTVGAIDKGMNVYTVPIARAYDVIRAAEANNSYLPSFMISNSLKKEVASPLKGFNGTLASLFNIPIDELHAANSAYRVKSENFNNMGYNTVADFLITQPRRYIDKTKVTLLEDIEYKEPVTLIGKIIKKEIIYYKHAKFEIDVGNTVFECMFYNRLWMIDRFNLNDEVLVMGEYQRRGQVTGQSLESLLEAQSLDIVPIYSQSAKNRITSKLIMNVVYEAIERIYPFVNDLTPYIKDKIEMSFIDAIKEMHFPTSSESYIGALETLALYELIYLQLLIIDRKANEVKDKGLPKVKRKNGYFDTMKNSLPWELTPAQKEGLEKIDKYMSTDTAEQILLSADVGSGKTVLAQLACMQALDNDYQSVLAAPTEVLARQLYDTFEEMIGLMPDDKRPTLAFIAGKMSAAEKRELLKYIKTGDINIVIGTHSVLNTNIEYKNLGLVVIDEQQKFGTAQREALLNIRRDGRKPDLLAQTATPIPRSTAQAFYGDIDLISLKGKPKGRIEIETKWIKENPKMITKNKKHKIWEDVMKEIEKGHQVFVVVPMVQESSKLSSASVEEAYKDLKKILPNAVVGYTHGSQKKADQQKTMEGFRNNEINILVASTVIEVGVDVPNSTRVIILSADRLGASSLHQIRGRVGRSNLPSTCYLVSEGKTKASEKRLQALVDSTDGFEIAKVDLETRGQGDLFGLRQAGESNLRFSNLVDHSKLVNVAQKIANDIYNSEYKDIAIQDAKSLLQEEVII